MSRGRASIGVMVAPHAELDPRFSEPGATPTSWDDVQRVLDGAELFWISTVRRDGRPHVTPVPAVWHEDALHFCTGPAEQKAVNLREHESCALTTGVNLWHSGLDVVVEGAARQVTDEDRLRALASAWASKYHGDWNFEVADGAFVGEGGRALVYEVVASKVLAFSKGPFAQTRYRFEGTEAR